MLQASASQRAGTASAGVARSTMRAWIIPKPVCGAVCPGRLYDKTKRRVVTSPHPTGAADVCILGLGGCGVRVVVSQLPDLRGLSTFVCANNGSKQYFHGPISWG